MFQPPIAYLGLTCCPSCGAQVHGCTGRLLPHLRRIQSTTAVRPDGQEWEPCPAGSRSLLEQMSGWRWSPGWRGQN